MLVIVGFHLHYIDLVSIVTQYWLYYNIYWHNLTVIVSADKAPNNIVCVCKSGYVDCLINELCIDKLLDHPTYTTMTLAKEELLENHMPVLISVGISNEDDELDLPSLYLIPGFLVSLQAALYCRIYQMLHETSFQIINISSSNC